MIDDKGMSRRDVLRGAAVVAGAAAFAPLLGDAALARPRLSGGNADTLFKAGRFEQAGNAYEEILAADPGNVNAARGRGYVALLSNEFADAEKFLGRAIELAPEDKEANYFLADCYIRQDKFSASVPHWKTLGEDAYARWFAAVRGEAYSVHGKLSRVPFLQTDPIPLVAASVNGGPPKRLSFYTGAPELSLTASVAREAGLKAVASQEYRFETETVRFNYGFLDSLKLGGIEIRNVPVQWSSKESGGDVTTENDGLIGTWVFYHLLSTFDYPGQSLILRRRSAEAAREVRTAAVRDGTKALPLWLAHEQYLHSTGSISGSAGSSGPSVVGVNFGGQSDSAAVAFGDTAKRLGIRTDHDRPIGTFAHSAPALTYPCYPKEIRLGTTAAEEIYCETNPNAEIAPLGFDTPTAFFQPFFKPYTITLDFDTMNLYIARGKRVRAADGKESQGGGTGG